MFVKALARAGRADTARLSVEQATSQLCLQIGEVTAEGRNRDPLALGRARKGSFLVNGGEIAELAAVHAFSISERKVLNIIIFSWLRVA